MQPTFGIADKDRGGVVTLLTGLLARGSDGLYTIALGSLSRTEHRHRGRSEQRIIARSQTGGFGHD